MTEEDIRLRDEAYMRLALAEAQKAAERGEVPIGAVVVWEDKDGTERVVSRACNVRETEKNALGHAECRAISDACSALHGWRLHRATLYVTLEPCPMCAGAIVNARVRRVCFGAKDAKAGAFGSVINLNSYPLNHKPEIVSGVLEPECRELLSSFFAGLRSKREENKKKNSF